jgi:4-hydroxybenzoate polyprenyltransferase
VIPDLVQLLRPWQWSKNGILFAGLIFSRHLLDPAYAGRAILAFVVFCLASSSVYALNDVLDAARDRTHPAKRNRPVAAGRVSRKAAGGISLLLALAAVGTGSLLGREFLVSLILFLGVNLLYSIRLKHAVVLDVLTIAISFVIRAIAGVMALRPLEPALELSPWLLVCTLFLALFLGFAKRRHELALLAGEAGQHRLTLTEYSVGFLDQLITIVTAGTLIAYTIYTIAPATVTKFHSPSLVYTIPFVVYGIFRYLYLIRERGDGGSPSRTLYRDVPLLVTIAGWLAVAVLVIYAEAL